jgi:adenosylcobinamide kinase/adenosylcobinamide-phosphate guanylyltransferase
MGKLIFVTGGVRSGKSSHALDLAGEAGEPVLFVATAHASDSEMVERIARHRAERPDAWRTREATSGELEEYVASGGEEVALLDCLTLYVGRRLTEGVGAERIASEVEETVRAMRGSHRLSVVVSNEVGCGVIPDNRLAREFSEALGRVNQVVAAAADEVLLMVSGIPLKVK